jgi:hypothetical protein
MSKARVAPRQRYRLISLVTRFDAMLHRHDAFCRRFGAIVHHAEASCMSGEVGCSRFVSRWISADIGSHRNDGPPISGHIAAPSPRRHDPSRRCHDPSPRCIRASRRALRDITRYRRWHVSTFGDMGRYPRVTNRVAGDIGPYRRSLASMPRCTATAYVSAAAVQSRGVVCVRRYQGISTKADPDSARQAMTSTRGRTERPPASGDITAATKMGAEAPISRHRQGPA